MIAVTNRFLVEGDFLMQLEKAHYLDVNERSRSDCECPLYYAPDNFTKLSLRDRDYLFYRRHSG